MEDKHGPYLERCRELARRAEKRGDTPVGAVVALNGEIMAEAEEEVPTGSDPFAHAELLVVRRAMQALNGRELKRATLYTTVEPCLLCSFAIRESGIGRVVIERPVSEIGGATSSFPILTTDAIDRWGLPPGVTWCD